MKVRYDYYILRFLLVGVGSNVANLLCYLAMLHLHTPVFVAAVSGYLLGLTCSYHFGRTWVFRRRFNANLGNITRFLIVYIVGGVGMSAITTVLVNDLMFNYVAGWLFGAGFAACNNFIGLKFIVFRSEQRLVD